MGEWVDGAAVARTDRSVPAVNQLHFIPVDLGSPIVQCAVADPCVVIMSAEGHVAMFLLKSDSYGGRHHRLALHKPPLHHVGPSPTPDPAAPTPPRHRAHLFPTAIQGDRNVCVPRCQRPLHH